MHKHTVWMFFLICICADAQTTPGPSHFQINWCHHPSDASIGDPQHIHSWCCIHESNKESTDLIEFSLRTANLDHHCRTNGGECVIFTKSNLLASFCEDRLNHVLAWDQADMRYWTKRAGQSTGRGERQRHRRDAHTHTFTARRENRFHTGDTGLVVSVT